jgi:hypothetical protein
MQVYQRLQRANALAQGEYVMGAGQMKVLRIRNASDVGIEGVRVEVTLNDGAIPARLTWSHNDSEIADLAPRGVQHVVVAMNARIGLQCPEAQNASTTEGFGITTCHRARSFE